MYACHWSFPDDNVIVHRLIDMRAAVIWAATRFHSGVNTLFLAFVVVK